MKIPNYSNYEIYPKEGKIWSYKSNRFVGAKNNRGYWICNLYVDDGTIWTTSIQRLVWQCINGTIPQGMQVNHIDEDKDNNSISNLNLLTAKENSNWGTHNERVSKAKKGKKQPNISKALKGRNVGWKNKISKALSKQVAAYKDGQLIMVFPSTMEAHRQMGYDQSAVSKCCRNKLPHYKGYQWRYL